MYERRVRVLMALVFILGLALASVSDAALVGWWKFNDGSGTVAKDSSGRGYDGTIIDPDWVEGKFGDALNFTGTNYVDVPAESWSTVTTQATVCFWAYGDPAAQPQANFIFGAFSDPANNEARRMCAHVPWSDGTVYFDTGGPGYNRINKAGNASDYEGAWTFWTFLKNADTGDQQIYINGVLWHSGTGMTQTMEGVTKFTIGTKPSLAEGWYRGMIDDFRLYDTALSVEEIAEAMTGRGPGRGLAEAPVPADESTDIPRDLVLAWTAGEFAASHDVYLGTAFDDVNTASRDNPMDLLVSEGQDDASFDAGRLELGQLYYWRVDEVNVAPDSTIYKGNVWSFTVEPKGYPITSLTVAASSEQTGSPAIRTIDESGLDDLDQHGVDLKTMWATPAGSLPASIQYAFDKVCTLHELWVWNSNSELELYMGFGAKDVTIEYSTDGETWTALENVPEFAKGTAQATYTANNIVDFGGVMAKYVKLTINTTWGATGIASISEVRFFSVPLAAREPVPEPGTVGVLPDATLSWRAGREAASHQVFLGTDANDLAQVATLDEPSFEADLNLGETYFWKVVEVNMAEAAPEWESDVWSFSTVAALVVDDFESYTDEMDADEAIFQTWIDGYEVEANGSIVGYGDATLGTFGETTIVYGGDQSMPFFYDNSGGATVAETTRTFDDPQDWTKHGYQTLSLAFYGDPNNTGSLYLKINNTKVSYNGDAGDIKQTQWLPWNIDLASTGASLANVTKLVIGVEGAGAAGTLYFDDIELQGAAPEFITPVDPGTSGLLAWYKFDGDLKDAVGTNHGTAVGDAKTTTDATRGQVLVLDGIGDAVEVPALGSVTALTIAMWVDPTIDPTPIEFASFFNSDDWTTGDLHWRYSYGKVDSGLYGLSNTTGKSVTKANQWNHVAITVSDTEWALWLNGYKEGSQSLTAVQTINLGDGLIGAWLNGASVERAFTGKIDDARFYDRALSQEEIGALAGRTSPYAKPY